MLAKNRGFLNRLQYDMSFQQLEFIHDFKLRLYIKIDLVMLWLAH